MGDILSLPVRQAPRCANCMFWTIPIEGKKFNRICELKDQQTNSDYVCEDHEPVKEREAS